MSTKPSSKAPVSVSVSGGAGLGRAGAWLLSPAPAAGQPAPAKAPYELCEAGCHASRRVLLSFHPVLPRLHNWLRCHTACPPCHACSTPASLALFVPINTFPAKSLLRRGWKCFEPETPSLHSCLFCFAALFHTYIHWDYLLKVYGE